MNDITFYNQKLTTREKEVVLLISKGMRNKDIGEKLYISETTVKKHVYNIFNKLHISSRFELVCKMQNDELINLDEAC